MAITFDRPDFLCIVPFAWGRSGKTARDAYRVALGNMPGAPYVESKAKAPALLYRFSDAVDQVQVHDNGSFTFRPAEGRDKADCEARLVWQGKCNAPVSSVPELPLEGVPE